MSNQKISAVINTWNEGHFLDECLKRLNFVDEIIVIDMESEDDSFAIAKKYTDKIFKHKHISYVEPVRNFGISKALGNWVLILDPDERVPKSLAAKLIEIVKEDSADYVRIPRKNIVFGQWLKHSRWWPDYNIRFFKKGSVTWQEEIHRPPITTGTGIDLPAEEELAIEHHHYSTIDEYILRQVRYTNQQVKELIKEGYQFNHKDAIIKPISEFLSRFFAGEGYKDGFHGLILSLLQAFSILVVYLKVWENEGFAPEREVMADRNWQKLFNEKFRELLYWIYTVKIHLSQKKTAKLIWKIKRKLTA